MGDLRPDNGGGTPDEGGGARSGGLPDLPPEWGTVIIPDDPAELAEEATALRRELRRKRRRARWSSALGFSPPADGQHSFGLPVVIMAIAVLITIVSLFVATWGRAPSTPVPPAGADRATTTTTESTTTGSISDVVLVDGSGVRVRLNTLLPGAFLLVEGCDCAALVRSAATAAPSGVHVVPVAREAPQLGTMPANVRALADPNDVLRTQFAAESTPAAGRATALLVDKSGAISVTELDASDDVGPAMRQLAGR